MLGHETQRSIELFLFHEAKLLDAGDFEAWLALYAPEGIYWMPSQRGQTDPLNVASIIYEDHAILAIRVQRLLEARALVLNPMPRTVHMISNIEVLSGDDASAEFEVGSAFFCTEFQGERHRFYTGRQTHRLARSDGAFRITTKQVALANCDGVHAPMTIPI